MTSYAIPEVRITIKHMAQSRGQSENGDHFRTEASKADVCSDEIHISHLFFH